MTTTPPQKKAGWGVITMLAAAQFIMVLDTTVMNVSITQVAADLNVALPLDPVLRLVADGVVGRLSPWMYSFMGYLPEPRQLVTENAPSVARRLAADRVDAVLLTPC